MNALRRLRNLWIPCVRTIALGCFSDAVAQVRYHVEDLGTLEDGFFGCTMGVNNHGWTETQYGLLEAGKLLKGRVAINVDGFTFPLPTLGGTNNWDNPFGGEINADLPGLIQKLIIPAEPLQKKGFKLGPSVARVSASIES